ncbi:MAG: hypothetical protein KDA24_28985, partial [Deltaproteobacteria bacterium]|nr:hypothetical protein [Deltaproteobacteria bacterium]
PWPLSAGVGGLVSMVPASAAASIEVPDDGGLYITGGAGELGADSWALQVKGGGPWPPAAFANAFTVPSPVTSPLPGPGNIGNLQAVQVSWDALGTEGDVEISMFRWTTANQTAWAAVRCRSADDGEMFVAAADLAAGNGDILVTISRAAWVTGPQSVGQDTVHAHFGGIRSIVYRLTPG